MNPTPALRPSARKMTDIGLAGDLPAFAEGSGAPSEQAVLQFLERSSTCMPPTHVILCMSRFVPQIVAHTKLHTVRAERKRPVLPGDLLDLREWTGRPYHSKQRKIGLYPCVGATRIEVDARHDRIFLFSPSHYYADDGYIMDEITFAQRDGFIYTHEFFQFFRDHHDGLCIGQLIEWGPQNFAPLAGATPENGEPVHSGRNAGVYSPVCAPVSPVRSSPSADGKREPRGPELSRGAAAAESPAVK